MFDRNLTVFEDLDYMIRAIVSEDKYDSKQKSEKNKCMSKTTRIILQVSSMTR